MSGPSKTAKKSGELTLQLKCTMPSQPLCLSVSLLPQSYCDFSAPACGPSPQGALSGTDIQQCLFICFDVQAARATLHFKRLIDFEDTSHLSEYFVRFSHLCPPPLTSHSFRCISPSYLAHHGADFQTSSPKGFSMLELRQPPAEGVP